MPATNSFSIFFTMQFAQFASYLHDIETVSSRLAITEKLAKLFSELHTDELAVVPYLLQGRVAPAYRGLEFGMAEKSLLKAAAQAFGLDLSDVARHVRTTGDLGESVETLRKAFMSMEEKPLSIAHVYGELYRITQATGEGSQESKANILAFLFTQLDPLSCKYLCRIPLGQLRLGASDVTILDAVSWMLVGDKSLRSRIEKAYQVRPDLGYICAQVLEKGVDVVETITPQVGTPILMMKAERLSSGAEIIEKIGQCMVEPKYDGLRLQVHIQKNKVQSTEYKEQVSNDKKYFVEIYTRGLELVTHMYPDIVDAVEREVGCTSAIMEGEALGYDEATDTFLPFQQTIQRKRKHDVAEAAKRIPLRFMAFDLLYMNGESCLHKPLFERKAQLQSLIASDALTIRLSPHEQVTDPHRVEALFDQYIGEGLEGIMAKRPESVYKPGAREFSWVKLKRSYSSKVNDTVDCVVMGYDAGKGKRAAFGIGAVLVGVYDQSVQHYLTIAKIGTGMTDEEWKTLKANSEKRIAKSKPDEYTVAKEMECDVWVLPHIVLEVRSDEITQSKIHSSGWSLRFPRLERFRADKRPHDATTKDEIDSLAASQKN